ncbi:thiamine biosynthesis protein ThiS [Gammaproteobacteria bacterium 45_16_T64]|nr:thiamine biosynthesis protein ThiS [Gammaproteobacteria bacterium 45_16_T64]
MGEQQLNIQVNGEVMALPPMCTVSVLVEQMSLTGKRIAVELNRDIVPKSEHASTSLKVGDVVEIVHAIGGG